MSAKAQGIDSQFADMPHIMFVCLAICFLLLLMRMRGGVLWLSTHMYAYKHGGEAFHLKPVDLAPTTSHLLVIEMDRQAELVIEMETRVGSE